MIRLALAILCFVAGSLLLVAVSFAVANSLTWLMLGHAYGTKAGAAAVAWLAVALLLCFPLARRFVRKQRAKSRRARIAAWAGAAAVITPLTLLVALFVLIGSITAAEIHECERAAFPLLACHDWHEECRKAGNCRYTPYWQARLRDFFVKQPASPFEEFEIAMYKRHVAAGWIDANNPEHVRAVDNEWGLAVEARRRRLLPDPET